MSNLQEKIQALLDHLVAEGRERGAQAAVYHQGKLIVNAWAGVANVQTGAPVKEDTLFPVFSSTKGIMATLIHLLAERGQLDYEAPVATYWPEFAAHGKGNITVRHLMNHTSGVPYMPDGIGYPEMCDWATITAAVADLKPAIPPGRKLIYQAANYGWLLGEVAHRIDGRPVGRMVQEEICEPLGIKSLFIGVPGELEPDVAYLEQMIDPAAPVVPLPDPALPAPIPNWMQPLHASMNRRDVRMACSPGTNGVMSAGALARHYAALLPGGVDGVELLPPARVQKAAELQPPEEGYDEGMINIFAYGYGKGDKVPEMGLSETAFGHGGFGGSMGFAEPRHGLAVGVVRNRFSAESLPTMVLKEVQSELGLT
jgi:CubicO group peptidase (beta-lactamase class C family)